MSIESYLTFYFEETDPNAGDLLYRLVSFFNQPSKLKVTRYLKADASWDKEALVIAAALEADEDPWDCEFEDNPTDLYFEEREIAELHNFPNPHLTRVSGGLCPIMSTLHEAILQNIPEEIRDNYSMWWYSLKVGPHDVWDFGMDEKPIFYARAAVSINLSAYFCPNDPELFVKAVNELPEFLAIKNGLESIIGRPAKQRFKVNA